jgi:hypothetical protein
MYLKITSLYLKKGILVNNILKKIYIYNFFEHILLGEVIKKGGIITALCKMGFGCHLYYVRYFCATIKKLLLARLLLNKER